MDPVSSERQVTFTQLLTAADELLVVALIARRPEAPRALLVRFSPMVRGILRRFLGRDGGIEDSIQEVFLQVFRTLPTLREPKALRAFVMAIATHTAMRQASRARARDWSIGSDDLDERGATVDVAAQHALMRLDAVLSGIRPCDRTAFLLRFVEGMCVDEIADAVRASPATVQRRYKRAWARVTYLASKDLFLRDYLQTFAVTS